MFIDAYLHAAEKHMRKRFQARNTEQGFSGKRLKSNHVGVATLSSNRQENVNMLITGDSGIEPVINGETSTEKSAVPQSDK